MVVRWFVDGSFTGSHTYVLKDGLDLLGQLDSVRSEVILTRAMPSACNEARGEAPLVPTWKSGSCGVGRQFIFSLSLMKTSLIF